MLGHMMRNRFGIVALGIVDGTGWAADLPRVVVGLRFAGAEYLKLGHPSMPMGDFAATAGSR